MLKFGSLLTHLSSCPFSAFLPLFFSFLLAFSSRSFPISPSSLSFSFGLPFSFPFFFPNSFCSPFSPSFSPSFSSFSRPFSLPFSFPFSPSVLAFPFFFAVCAFSFLMFNFCPRSSTFSFLKPKKTGRTLKNRAKSVKNVEYYVKNPMFLRIFNPKQQKTYGK